MKEEQGMNVLVCSHLLRDIEQVCDEAVILKDGAIVHQCNLEEDRRSNKRFVELEVTGDDRNLRMGMGRPGRPRWNRLNGGAPPGGAVIVCASIPIA